MTDYDPAQLRTFLAVVQTSSFTQAATRLGIRQPTVSQHVRKLEEATGRVLVARDTHSVTITPDGEAMIGFARSILASHADAAAYFSGERPQGRLRIGMSDDLALTRLPQILRDFRCDHPRVDLDLTVDQSGTLHRRLENDRLDLFVGKRPRGEDRGKLVKRERLVWVGTATTRLDPTRALPLVVYPSPSISRSAMQSALERAGVAYRSACVCRGVNGLIAAVAAGIQGQVSDLEIHAAEMTRLRALMEATLAHHTGRSPEQVHADVERDKILDAQQAVDYGIVDSIIQSRKLSAVR